jgi:hypothetical protein
MQRPIKIETLSSKHSSGDKVSHPHQIDMELSWTDERPPIVDEVTFNVHDTPLKRVEWSKNGGKYSHVMGYCSLCRVLFIVEKVRDTASEREEDDWELHIFKHLFRTNEEFREKIMKDAA